MTTELAKKTEFFVNDAAARFNRTTARIRQICIEHEIGELVGGRIRRLNPADMRKIGRIIEEFGYEKSS